MPNSVLRAALATSVLIAALLVVGLGAGSAVADPTTDPDPGTVSEPGTGTEPPVVNEPQPTTPTTPATEVPTIFDIPNALIGGLRDFFGRPLSVFGNGRVPGTHTITDPGKRRHDRVPATQKAVPTKAPPTDPEPEAATDASDDVAPPDATPPPDDPAPAPARVRWRLRISDPYAALTSVADTLNTVNALLSDALAPYNPFPPPPPPPPSPAFRTFEEEPVVDAGAAGPTTPLSSGSSDLTVLQVPVLIPQVRVAPPLVEVRIPGSATVGVRDPAGGNQVAQSGSPPANPAAAQPVPATPVPANPAPARPVATGVGPGSVAPREGYSDYLRTARTTQLVGVAIPGLVGLLALTAGGGVIGYRQANSGRLLRADAGRFLA